MCNPFHINFPSECLNEKKKLGFTGISFSYLENPLKNTLFPSNDREMRQSYGESIIFPGEGE